MKEAPVAKELEKQLALGDQLLRRRDLEPALEVFRSLTESFPDTAAPWLGLGRCFLSKGDLVSASHFLEQSLALDRSSTWGLRLLFLSEAVAGRGRRCLELLQLLQPDRAFWKDHCYLTETVHRVYSRPRFGWRNTLRWLRGFGPRDLYAILCIRLMLTFRLTFLRALVADAIWNNRMQLRADECLEIVLRDRLRFLGWLSPKNALRLSYLAVYMSEADAATKLCEEGEAQYPRHSNFPLLCGNAHVLRGDLSAAATKYSDAIRKDQADWRGRLQLGATLALLSKAKEAAAEFRQAARLSPHHAAASHLGKLSQSVLEVIPRSEGLAIQGDRFSNTLSLAEMPPFCPDPPWSGTPILEELFHGFGMKREKRRHRLTMKSALPCRSCPACGSTSTGKVFANQASDMSLSRCSECGHVFPNPMPTDKGLELLYGHEYFDTGWAAYAEMVLNLFREGMPLPSYPSYDSLMDWQARIDPSWWGRGGEGRSAVDLGCANGAMIFAMRNRGWSVRGQDVSDRFASYFKELEIPFYAGKVTDLDIEDSSVDLVTMTHVIEHLASPDTVLARIASWLKPGGRLVVMTPCCGTITAWLAGKPWFYMTEHVQFFTPQALMRLGMRTGLEPLYYRTRVGVRYETPFRAWRRNLMGGALEKLLEAIGQGDVIEIVFTKPPTPSPQAGPTPPCSPSPLPAAR